MIVYLITNTLAPNVYNLTTGQIFYSIKSASLFFGVRGGNISKNIRGQTPTVGDIHFIG